jgi:hypothetical protein
MRISFKWLLPTIQIVIALSLLWAHPLQRFMPMYGHPDGYRVPRDLPADVINLAGANLPAVPVVTPIYVLFGGRDHINNTPSLIACFGFVGIAIWFFVGRFVDDVFAALRRHPNPKRRLSDLLFFALVILACLSVLAESDVVSFALSWDESKILVYSMCWLAFGGAGLVFQVWEMRRRASVLKLNSEVIS